MKIYGLDVEMVQVEPNFTKSAARVTLVQNNSQCVYDKYVKQDSRVLCYRTQVSGIKKNMLVNGRPLHLVRSEVLSYLKNSVVVGHSIDYDLEVLKISDNDLKNINCVVRDTTTYSRFKNVRKNGTTPSLKELAKLFLHKEIQDGAHSSVEDAHAVVQLYTMFKQDFEREILHNKQIVY